jgi:polar amino acid transport system substrate-binding protein
MMIRRLLLVALLCGFALLVTQSGLAAGGQNPTRVPPTLLPPASTATPYPTITRSALARIRERATPTLIVGVPANSPPFSVITDTGEYQGFDADLARAIAADWGVQVNFRQVTKQNAYALLQSGQIDLLMGGQMPQREMPAFIDYSDPYFISRQVALALADTSGDINVVNGQNVGVVISSAAQAAFAEWQARTGIPATVLPYAMLDDAIRDLSDRRIMAVVADRWELDQRVRGKIEGVRLLDGVYRTDPYAIAMLRYDDSLRTLVNRTLQRFVSSERLNEIYNQWFPEGLMPLSDRVLPFLWRDLDADTRTVACAGGSDCLGFPADVVIPAASALDKIRAGQPLRVAGFGSPLNPDGSTSPLEQFNQALINELARRWNAPMEIIPTSYSNAEELLAAGAADLIVGAIPRWGTVDRFDYVGVYAARGYKLMVRIGSEVEGFGGLRLGKRVIGTFADDPGAFDVARKLAISVGIPERTIQHVVLNNGPEAVEAVSSLQTVRVLYADSLRITPLVASYPAQVQATNTLYDKRLLAFAVPRNDVNFRWLIDFTLQEMARDGTYQRLWETYWRQDQPLNIIVMPGGGFWQGVRTSG